jgi:putative ABC transport system substrate-binding protein
MRRRTFIAGLGSTAAWPVVARAQQADRVRRIGVLMAADENDSESKRRYSAFTQALADLGWTDGRLKDFDRPACGFRRKASHQSDTSVRAGVGRLGT